MLRENLGEFLDRLRYRLCITDDLEGARNTMRPFGGRRTAGVDQPPGDACRRKVRVGNDQLVAVAHRRQRVQQIGVQQRMDTFQHLIIP